MTQLPLPIVKITAALQIGILDRTTENRLENSMTLLRKSQLWQLAISLVLGGFSNILFYLSGGSSENKVHLVARVVFWSIGLWIFLRSLDGIPNGSKGIPCDRTRLVTFKNTLLHKARSKHMHYEQ